MEPRNPSRTRVDYFLRAALFPDGAWGGENVICTGQGKYYGWDKGEKTYSEWRALLADMYNRDIKPDPPIAPGDLPAFNTKVGFFDVARIGQEVFDQRKKEEAAARAAGNP